MLWPLDPLGLETLGLEIGRQTGSGAAGVGGRFSGGLLVGPSWRAEVGQGLGSQEIQDTATPSSVHKETFHYLPFP